MSKGPGKLQRLATELCADGVTLISGDYLAHLAAGAPPTDSQVRSARRTLQTLAANGAITDHGFAGGTGRKIYGGPLAKQIDLDRAYRQAMQSFR
jgi:hypothetical protein